MFLMSRFYTRFAPVCVLEDNPEYRDKQGTVYANIENFIQIVLIFLIFLLKILVVVTRYNRLCEAVITSNHNAVYVLEQK